MAIEIVSFPIKHGHVPSLSKAILTSPEGFGCLDLLGPTGHLQLDPQASDLFLHGRHLGARRSRGGAWLLGVRVSSRNVGIAMDNLWIIYG